EEGRMPEYFRYRGEKVVKRQTIWRSHGKISTREWRRSCVPTCSRSNRNFKKLHKSLPSSSTAKNLLESIRSRRARCGVIGLGYVGLPLAVEFARAGFVTTGIDLDPAKVRAINEGRSYIDDVAGTDVADLQSQGRLKAVGDFD